MRGGDSSGEITIVVVFRTGLKQSQFVGVGFDAADAMLPVGKTDSGDRIDTAEKEDAEFHDLEVDDIVVRGVCPDTMTP